jgi:hypothetical protein
LSIPEDGSLTYTRDGEHSDIVNLALYRHCASSWTGQWINHWTGHVNGHFNRHSGTCSQEPKSIVCCLDYHTRVQFIQSSDTTESLVTQSNPSPMVTHRRPCDRFAGGKASPIYSTYHLTLVDVLTSASRSLSDSENDLVSPRERIFSSRSPRNHLLFLIASIKVYSSRHR